MDEFGVIWFCRGVYLQRKHTKARMYAKSSFLGHTVPKQEESALCSEVS